MSYPGQNVGSGTVTSVGITASANITVTGSPVTSTGDIDLQMVEVDPVYTASDAASITATDITNLSNLSGTNTGDQDLSVLLDKTTYDPATIGEQVVGLTASQVLSNKTIHADGVIRLMGYTVATLPAGTQGDTAFVTDALAPTFLTAVVGGGAVVTTVFYDGTNWIVQ